MNTPAAGINPESHTRETCNKLLSGTQEKESLAKELIIAYCFLHLFSLYILHLVWTTSSYRATLTLTHNDNEDISNNAHIVQSGAD